jgi:hypothetical protein
MDAQQTQTEVHADRMRKQLARDQKVKKIAGGLVIGTILLIVLCVSIGSNNSPAPKADAATADGNPSIVTVGAWHAFKYQDIECADEETYKKVDSIRMSGDNEGFVNAANRAIEFQGCKLANKGDVVYVSESHFSNATMLVHTRGEADSYWTGYDSLDTKEVQQGGQN